MQKQELRELLKSLEKTGCVQRDEYGSFVLLSGRRILQPAAQ